MRLATNPSCPTAPPAQTPKHTQDRVCQSTASLCAGGDSIVPFVVSFVGIAVVMRKGCDIRFPANEREEWIARNVSAADQMMSLMRWTGE